VEIIRRSSGKSIDEIAEMIFMKSIEILGGLRRLMEYRNLTWLPSLAESAYAVALRNEALKTHSEIAKELGIAENTVKNILSADEDRVMEYLIGNNMEKPKEHIAGGIAKLAYRALKKEGRI